MRPKPTALDGPRQEAFDFFRKRALEGRPPTVRELQRGLHYKSSASARDLINWLVKHGYLERPRRGLSRNVVLPTGIAPKGKQISVPILGSVQAGALALAAEDVLGYLTVQTKYPAEEVFALRVRGESMIGAGLMPNDWVIVHRQPTAESGQIVVALIEDEATIKTLKRGRGRGSPVELHPANPKFSVQRYDPDVVTILGRVIESRRQYE